MCRVRFTLAERHVVSKPKVARWALEHVEREWRPLIECAAVHGDCDYDETVAFVRSTLAAASC